MRIKDIVREILIFFHLDLTKNLKYDRYTKQIIRQQLRQDDDCIDVGCHKGEILQLFFKYAPKGRHYAFEPIPEFFLLLQKQFGTMATLYPYALSDESGKATFQYVKNAPAYSGLKKRKYDVQNPDIQEIHVEKKTLDELLPEQRVDFIKIDVEGGEFGVLKGAKKLLQRCRPSILFEFGKGASDYYGTQPAEVFAFLTKEIGLNIYTLHSFLQKQAPLNEKAFEHCFQTNQEYYFIASK